jgi:hypothetical protein
VAEATLSLTERLEGAAARGLRPEQLTREKPAGFGTTKQAASKQEETARRLGMDVVGFHSPDERIEEWEAKLWNDQSDYLEELHKEWRQALFYCANVQYIAYHRTQHRWIPRKTVPWRIRSIYNVVQKAVNIRVARLTENKPAVSVQAATVDREDLEKTEYKETLFWHLWQTLNLQGKWVRARSWAAKCASGFLKVGWDPDAGPETPVTLKRAKYKTVEQPITDPMTGAPVLDPATGQPATQPQQLYDGIEEVYLDRTKRELGPVFVEEQDPEDERRTIRRRQPVPDEADTYHEGEAFVEAWSPFGIRWDPNTDDLDESWYVQAAEVLTGSQVLSYWPKKIDVLEDATTATEEEKALQWRGITNKPELVATGVHQTRVQRREGKSEGVNRLDQEYLVRETWIFPKNEHLRTLWGRKGALLITVGHKLVQKSSLPEWALEACPFIQVPEIHEEGNHYRKSFLRDLIPLQDDINRARSTWAEQLALRARLLLWAPDGHNLNFRLLGGLPGTLCTSASPEFKPEALNLGAGAEGIESFYGQSLEAAADIGNMNEASTGKLPSAGLAAKAIYALQYADERSIQEVSNAQDLALKQLAEALDAVTRKEYKERRKVRIMGRDRSYLLETEIAPEHLDLKADYQFVPGSMLSRSKEAVKNELFQLKEQGLVSDALIRKVLPTAVPDAFRESYDLHESKARRILHDLLNDPELQVAPKPYDDLQVHLMVFQEFMLTKRFELLGDQTRTKIEQYWQALQAMLAPPPVAPGGPEGSGAAPAAGGAPPVGEQPTPGGPQPGAAAQGVEALASEAEAAAAPPPGFGQPEGGPAQP